MFVIVLSLTHTVLVIAEDDDISKTDWANRIEKQPGWYVLLQELETIKKFLYTIHSNKCIRWIFIFCLSILFHFLVLILLSNIKLYDIKSSINIPKNKLNIKIVNSKIKYKKTLKKVYDDFMPDKLNSKKKLDSVSITKKTLISKKRINKSLIGHKKKQKLRTDNIVANLNNKNSQNIQFEKTPFFRKKTPLSSLKAIDLDSLSITTTKVIEELDKDDYIKRKEVFFDPRFRKKIELSRKEQKRLLNVRSIYRTKSKIEVLSRKETEMTIRVGNTCFEVPLDNSFYPKDLRIMTFKLNCPKSEKN